MGFFSSLKNKLKKALKWVKRVVKAIVRLVVRIVMTALGIGLGIFDFFFGFLAWPAKKLRLQIFILANPNGPVVDPAAPDLTAAVEFARHTLKARFNVEMLPYGRSIIELIKEPAPSSALTVHCGWSAFGEDFGEAGEFFAKHLAGWNGIPISVSFPITVFIVSNVVGKQGCSLGPLTDYVTVDPDGVATPSLMIHEIGHAFNLLKHSSTKSNLMFKDSARGDKVKWFQKNLVRSSRHVTYW